MIIDRQKETGNDVVFLALQIDSKEGGGEKQKRWTKSGHTTLVKTSSKNKKENEEIRCRQPTQHTFSPPFAFSFYSIIARWLPRPTSLVVDDDSLASQMPELVPCGWISVFGIGIDGLIQSNRS